MPWLAKKLAKPRTPRPTCLSMEGERYSPVSPTPVRGCSSHSCFIPSTKATSRSSMEQAPRLTCWSRQVPRCFSQISSQTFGQMRSPLSSKRFFVSQISPDAMPFSRASMNSSEDCSRKSSSTVIERFTQGRDCLEAWINLRASGWS